VTGQQHRKVEKGSRKGAKAQRSKEKGEDMMENEVDGQLVDALRKSINLAYSRYSALAVDQSPQRTDQERRR
jgi:hypothetical protein